MNYSKCSPVNTLCSIKDAYLAFVQSREPGFLDSWIPGMNDNKCRKYPLLDIICLPSLCSIKGPLPGFLE